MVQNVQDDDFLWELGCELALREELEFRSVKRSTDVLDRMNSLSQVPGAGRAMKERTAP